MILNEGAILCAQVSGNPEVVWPLSSCGNGVREYVFRIAPDCDIDGQNDELFQPLYACMTQCNIADFNGSGAVTVQDLFDFLSAWFARSIFADVNGSGTVTVQDLFDFLGSWFACD